MAPVPLEIVLSRMTPQELCEALALLRWCVRVGTVDAETADRLTRQILARPSFRTGGEPVEAKPATFATLVRCMLPTQRPG